MARTNQGVFKEIKNQYNALGSQLDCFENDYYLDGDLTCDLVNFFTDYVYDAEAIYIKADELLGLINGMLLSTKFENDDKRNTYVNLLSKTQDIKHEIKKMFDSAVYLISSRSSGLEDIEQRTLDKLSIYHQ